VQPSTEVAAPKQSLLAIVANLEELWGMAETAESTEERNAAESEIQRVVSMELADKLDAIGWFERRNEAEIMLAKQMITDIQVSIKRRERRIEQVRSMVQHAMERLGTPKIKGGMFTASIRQGTEHVVIDGGANIDAAYCRVVPAQLVPNKDEIKRALRQGVEVAGARLERGPATLSIR
jgi:hypothetical protein